MSINFLLTRPLGWWCYIDGPTLETVSGFRATKWVGGRDEALDRKKGGEIIRCGTYCERDNHLVGKWSFTRAS